MPDTCVAYRCTNRSGKTAGVGFYRFPADSHVQKRELACCVRAGSQAGKPMIIPGSAVPSEMPSMCTCGSKFSVEHALLCAKGGFPSIRHNEIRNLMATLLTEVCHDVCIEPGLQPVSNETLTGASANRQDGARLDIYIAASGFWGGTFERTFFDVRVFNPHAPSNRHTQLRSCYRKHEQMKKLISATGGLANEASTFYKRLASLLASKWDHPYSSTLRWLCCSLGISLLCSAIQSIRGARSSCEHAIRTPTAVNLINAESNISPDV